MTSTTAFQGVSILTIEPLQAGQRIDNFLVARLKGVPKTRIYRLLRKGEIRVNKKRIKPEYKLEAGDLVRLPPIRVAERDEPPTPSASLTQLLRDSVLHDDQDLLVLNKPSGLASHGGTGVKLGLIEAIRQIWGETGLELAHRLDKGTSGCIVITRHLAANNHMTALFREHQVQKTYHALVCGCWPGHLTEVNAPLERQTPRSGERRVQVSEEGKSALTRFRLLSGTALASLVEASPASGRTHQIRVHAQISGHPLIGDEKYGTEERNREWKTKGVSRLCLHARELVFLSPSGSRLSIMAPYDAAFKQALSLLKD